METIKLLLSTFMWAVVIAIGFGTLTVLFDAFARYMLDDKVVKPARTTSVKNERSRESVIANAK